MTPEDIADELPWTNRELTMWALSWQQPGYVSVHSYYQTCVMETLASEVSHDTLSNVLAKLDHCIHRWAYRMAVMVPESTRLERVERSFRQPLFIAGIYICDVTWFSDLSKQLHDLRLG